MTTQRAHHHHHTTTRFLRKLNRALTSRATPDTMDDVRTKQVHAEQVQFVRNFRM
ncbi:MAG: hypothetical protein ABR500_08025 [Dermatophilaceae bacterium]|nr:hypothetical protein [Intrasporangiaceae bacterium]